MKTLDGQSTHASGQIDPNGLLMQDFTVQSENLELHA